jgi:hypothetical protein
MTGMRMLTDRRRMSKIGTAVRMHLMRMMNNRTTAGSCLMD